MKGLGLRSLTFNRQAMLIVTLILVVIIIAVSFMFRDYVQDDVFITYTYSRNIAQGVGFVFNPDERVQGTTTPLWTLIMAAAHVFPFDIRHVGNILSGVLLLITCLLSMVLLNGWTGIAAALLIAASPLHYASFGMETMLYCALLVGAFVSWSRGKPMLAIILAGALTWTRADGVVLGGTLCLLAFFDGFGQTRKLGSALWNAIRFGIVYLLVIAVWFGFAWAYFGSPLPNTFGAKQEFLRGIDFLIDGVERWQTFFGANPLNLLAIPLIGVGAWTTFRNRRLRPVVAWTALYALGYTALNITNFWYYTPLFTGLILLTALGGARVFQWITHTESRTRFAVAGFGILLTVVALANTARALELHPPPPRMATYQLAGTWIDQHTPPDSSLLVADLGIVGYYAHRHTIDSFGLIVPDVATTLPIKTPEYATQTFQPDLILATQYFLWRYTAELWFQDMYAPMAAFSTVGDAEFSPMTLYRRRELMDLQRVEEPAIWQPFASLIRADLPRDPVWSGGEIEIALTWAALDAADRDYTTFVHLVSDETAPPIAQADAPPPLPTSEWIDGAIMTQTYRLIVPPNTPDGRYAIRLGWYADLERVPIDDGDAFHLTDIDVRFPGGSGMP